MPRTPTPLQRPKSGASLLSNTTYHSFHDMELSEPPQQDPSSTEMSVISGPQEGNRATEMQRHDSGYESVTPQKSARPSSASGTRRRTSGPASTTGSTTSGKRERVRQSVRKPVRSATSTSAGARASKPAPRSNRRSLYSPSSPVSTPQPANIYDYHGLSNAGAGPSYFHFRFPEPEPVPEQASGDPAQADNAAYAMPPPTTHYWTSDRTRRLEYAAIDAASRGVKGWMMRYLVPDCFVPKANRRIGFDDDTGSVRRYRIELESEDSVEKNVNEEPLSDSVRGSDTRPAKRRGWLRSLLA